MKSAVLSIGNELLNGRTLNSNAGFIGKLFLQNGIALKEVVAVEDDVNEISSALRRLIKKYQLIIITGGIGPTCDDVTLEGVAKALKRKMVLNENVKISVSEKMRNSSQMVIDKQSLCIEGSILYDNPSGVAFCHRIKTEGGDIFIIPGVPHEALYLMKSVVMKKIKKSAKKQYHPIRIYGMGESSIYSKLADSFGKENLLNIAFLPSFGYVDVITDNESVEKYLKAEYKQNILKSGMNPLNIILSGLFLKKKLTVSVSESCTAGLISKMITDVPGSSSYFSGGIIAYSDEVKTDILGVKKSTIHKYGAVSKETSEEMCRCTSKMFKTDVSISVTGIAGPSGETKNKSVGNVFITTFYKKKYFTGEYNFIGDREAVRNTSANIAIFNVLRRIIYE